MLCYEGKGISNGIQRRDLTVDMRGRGWGRRKEVGASRNSVNSVRSLLPVSYLSWMVPDGDRNEAIAEV